MLKEVINRYNAITNSLLLRNRHFKMCLSDRINIILKAVVSAVPD